MGVTRILVLSNLYPPNVIGGYERLCFDVTTRLAELGYSITVLTSRYGDHAAEYPGQRVLRAWDLLIGGGIYEPFAGTIEQRNEINRHNLDTLRNVIDETRPDVVFAWNLFFLDASIVDALEKSRVRTVVMLTDNWLLVMQNPVFVREFFQEVVHGSRPFEPERKRTFLHTGRQRIRRLFGGRTPDGLEAVFGSAFVRDLYAAGGIEFARSKVIHNGVKATGPKAVDLADRARLVRSGTLSLLFAGRFVDLKGAHVAVDAIRLLDPAALGNARIRLTLVGDRQDLAYLERLERSIVESGHAADIVMQPSVPAEQLPALFEAHDVYLFPSLYEPFSLTLIHALDAGIPTIATRVGGNTEIVRDGESGLLVEKSDPVALAGAVTRLATDGTLRVRLAEGGRKAARGFTFEGMVDGMATFLASGP